MRSLKPALLAAAGAALLSACATVGPTYQTPTPVASSSYAMAGDQPVAGVVPADAEAGDWWRTFHSADLDAVIRQAASGNRSIAAMQARLQQARDAIAAQASQLSGDASAGVQRERVNLSSFGFSSFPGISGNPTFWLYSFGANGRYDFDLWGGRKREHESREAAAEAEALQADAARLTLSAQVAAQAFAIAGLKAQIEAAGEILKSDRSNLDLVSKAYQLGGGTRLDVTTVQTELAGDEAVITPLKRQLATARHALALLVGQAPDAWSPPDFDLSKFEQPAAIPVALPSDVARSRPDIRAAEARLHRATAEIGVAQADLYPKIGISASIAQGALTPGDLFKYASTGFAVGPEVSLPLFNRKELKARRAMAEDEAKAALADYEQTVLSAFTQVADAMQAVGADDEAIALAQRQVGASADSLNLERLRYSDGKTGLLPVLDSQRSYARATQALARARAQRLMDVAALLYATSRGWRTSTDPATQVASR